MNKVISNDKQIVCPVRPFAPPDLQRVALLAGQLGYPSNAEDIGKRLRDMQNLSQHAVFVAEGHEGRVVGWVGTSVFRSVELDGFAEISGLIVDEDNRSCGVGKLLLHAAEEWARSTGSTILCVSSNVVRTRAHRFYERNGYEQLKIQKVFCKTLG